MSKTAQNTNAHADPRAAAEVRRQLADLARLRETARAYGTPDFASRVGLDSILGHEQSLLEELRAAELLESESAAEIAFDGDPVQGHAIHAAFLGVMLTKVQQLVNALAQAMVGVPTAVAPLPRNIVAENRLIVTGWVPSSFAVRFRLPTREELGQLVDTESLAVLGALTELLGGPSLSQNAVEWVSLPRVKKHYSEFLEVLAKQGASLTLRTRRNPYGVGLTTQGARDRVEWLDLLQVTESAVTMSGVLVGGNVESGRFELKAEDEVFRGYTTETAKNQMKQIRFGASVRADLAPRRWFTKRGRLNRPLPTSSRPYKVNRDLVRAGNASDRPAYRPRGHEPMTTQTADEKARKRAANLQKRRAALVEAMQKDVRQLRKIIHGKGRQK